MFGYKNRTNGCRVVELGLDSYILIRSSLLGQSFLLEGIIIVSLLFLIDWLWSLYLLVRCTPQVSHQSVVLYDTG